MVDCHGLKDSQQTMIDQLTGEMSRDLKKIGYDCSPSNALRSERGLYSRCA